MNGQKTSGSILDYKKCPFCGERNVELRECDDGEGYLIDCMGCSARGPESLTIAGAFALWNMRSEN